jgi:cation diffusion facilitator CzcD-associated flavoprotein CzcO
MTKYFNASKEEINDLGFDPDELLAKYNRERDKRRRTDGVRQYSALEGKFDAYATDPNAPTVSRDAVTEELDVVIVGGGMSGLVAAVQLRSAAVNNFRVIDIAGDFGGGWYWNRYPGLRCDVESYVYMPLLEEMGYVPTEKYASGQEILQHVQNVARRFDLYKGALFQTHVLKARWLEDSRRWLVTTNRGDSLRARFVIKTNGALDRPKLPAIPGITNFKGKSFHTSRWDYSYTGGDANGGLVKLQDKVVAVIGTGCTTIQCVPFLAKYAKHLFVFQRTPSSVDVRGNRPTDPTWASSLQKGWQQERRRNFISITSGGHEAVDLVDDAWTAAVRAVGGMYNFSDSTDSPERVERRMLINDFKKMNQIRDRIDACVTNKSVAEALKPWYRQFCKRPTFSDEYLPVFDRPNVTLVDTRGHGVDEIKETSLVVAGLEYPVDCIIFATGFEVGTGWSHRSGFEIYGRDGIQLGHHWSKGAKTLHGFYSSGFPNLLHMGITQNAVSYSYTFNTDRQALHIAELLKDALDQGVTLIEPTSEAEAEWCETIRIRGGAIERFQDTCTPSYNNNEGDTSNPNGTFGQAFGGTPLEYWDLVETWRKGDRKGLIWGR